MSHDGDGCLGIKHQNTFRIVKPQSNILKALTHRTKGQFEYIRESLNKAPI